MCRILLLASTALLLFIQPACTNTKKDESKTTESGNATTGKSPETPSDIQITGHLATLGLNADSDWRGVNMGDDFAVVQSAEKGEPFEKDAKHVGYTIDLPNLETADMLYYQANQKVSAIDIDLFLNTQQSISAYRSELEPYFTARYGTPKSANGATLWMGAGGKTVLLKDVSKGKDFGLKIKIAPAGVSATASAR